MKCGIVVRIPSESRERFAPGASLTHSRRSMRCNTRTTSARARLLVTCGLIVATVAASACNFDQVNAPAATGPVVPASLSRLSDSIKAAGQLVLLETGLLRDVPLLEPVVVSQMITWKKGGKIEIKELGLEVDVPKEAIEGDSLLITVTALPGVAVAYDFQPHGTKFLKPLEFEQSLKDSNWGGQKLKATLYGGYFASADQIDMASGLAIVNELITAYVTGNKVEFDIWHFSGYMVSTGRKSSSQSVSR